MLPHLPAKPPDEAVVAARNPAGVTVAQHNMSLHQMLTRGYDSPKWQESAKTTLYAH